MACPASLYLTKLVYPEAGKPVTAGEAPITVETPYVNAIDAAAAGVKDGLWLALNVAAFPERAATTRSVPPAIARAPVANTDNASSSERAETNVRLTN